MPQMAPMNWLILFIYFILIFMLFNVINYFMFNYMPMKIKALSKKKINYNWKW